MEAGRKHSIQDVSTKGKQFKQPSVNTELNVKMRKIFIAYNHKYMEILASSARMFALRNFKGLLPI